MNAARCAVVVAVVAWLGGLAWVGPDLLAAQAQEKKGEPGARERKEMQEQAVTLVYQGWEHEKKGRLEDAIRVLQQALSLHRKLYPEDTFPNGHPNLASNLYRLASALHSRLDLVQAERCYREALAMWRKLAAQPGNLDCYEHMGFTLNDLGLLLKQRGELAEAERCYREAVAVYGKLYPPARFPDGNPELASALNNLAALLRARGRLAQAEPFYRDALAMRRKLYPPARFPDGHPDLAYSLNGLSRLQQALGELAEAKRFARETLAMCRRLYPQARFPDGHAQLATSLYSLGEVLLTCGELAQAEPLEREALVMLRRLYPPTRYPAGHPDLAIVLNNLGSLLQERGELAQAEPLLRDALGMCRKLYPPARYPDGHPELARGLNNLGTLLYARGEVAQAEPLLREALAMRRKLYPDGHPHLVSSLNNLAFLLQARGELAEAERCCRDALAMCRQLYPKGRFPDGHPDLAYQLNNLGTLLDDCGKPAPVESLLREALDMNRALYPPARFPTGHPVVATGLNNLGQLLQSRGEYARAERYAREAVAMYQRLTAAFAEATAEAEALNFLARLPRAQNLYLSVTANLPASSAAEVYAVLWQGRGILARTLERRQRLLHALTENEVRRQLQELLDVRRELARRILRPDLLEKDRPQRLRELTERRERLERTLAGKLPQLEETPPNHTDLLKRLPADAAFVDLLRCRYRPPGKNEWQPRYVAFVLRKGVKVVRVELGAAEPIEKALAAWRKDIGNGLDSKAAAELRQRLWDRLAPHLPTQPGSTVYLCPDADLSALPWAALPGRARGTILLEDHALALVPHGQALLDQLQPRDKDRQVGVLLALGGPRFDQAPDPARRPDDLAAVRPAQRSTTDGIWPELPGSAREAGAIAGLARRLPRPPKVVERAGSAASATQLYLDLPHVRWAHLATHGFFAAPETKERKYLFDEKVFRLGVEGLSGRERLGAGARHPLTQTGLVLAGANRKGKDAPADGGILTAEAIAGLDLSKLDLAVLSACETGLGEAATGEGVFGLQRAFHLGGCRNVVASLWKVDDDATAALMNLFYHELWLNERPPLEALRQAQLALYRHPGEVRALATVRGPDFDKTVRRVTQPPRQGERPQRAALVRDWAAFVLSGSGR